MGEDRVFPLTDVAEIAAGGPILILAPHPVDELLGCGGLMAEAAQRNLPFHLVMVTGEPGALGIMPALPVRDARRIDMLRRAETLTAVARLGGSAAMVSFLDLPEGALAADGQAFGIAVDVVAAMLRHHKAATLLAPWHADPDPDHAATAQIAKAAARGVTARPRRLEYAIGGQLPQGRSTAGSGFALAVGTHRARLHWALEAYRSAVGTMEGRLHERRARVRPSGLPAQPQSTLPFELRRIVSRPVECFLTPDDCPADA